MTGTAPEHDEGRRIMTNMLERVAAALDRAGPSEDSLTKARSIVEAMREPTEAMREAWEGGLHEQTADGDWNAMIDAILDERARMVAVIGANLDGGPRRQAMIAAALDEMPGRSRASTTHL